MDKDTHFTHIGIAKSDELLKEYTTVVPSKLSDLDEQRYNDIPESVAQRKNAERWYITKDELIILVNWKLSHGTFRPTLQKLVQQNTERDVQAATASAFATDSLTQGLNHLTKLKGVGPATASLLLSVNNPENVPFFSDELFRWSLWDDKPGCRWDRKIKYTAKEYGELAAKVGQLQARLKDAGDKAPSAVDLEKVAYVLGKRAASSKSGDLVGHASASTNDTIGNRKRKTNPDEESSAIDRKRLHPEKSDKKAPAKTQSPREKDVTLRRSARAR